MIILTLFTTFLSVFSVIAGPYNCDTYGAASYGDCADTSQVTQTPPVDSSPNQSSAGNQGTQESQAGQSGQARNQDNQGDDQNNQDDQTPSNTPPVTGDSHTPGSPTNPPVQPKPSFFASIPFIAGALDSLKAITQPLAKIGYDVVIPGALGLSVLASLLLLPLARRRRNKKNTTE